jgi:hypothetical protein
MSPHHYRVARSLPAVDLRWRPPAVARLRSTQDNSVELFLILSFDQQW